MFVNVRAGVVLVTNYADCTGTAESSMVTYGYPCLCCKEGVSTSQCITHTHTHMHSRKHAHTSMLPDPSSASSSFPFFLADTEQNQPNIGYSSTPFLLVSSEVFSDLKLVP